MSSLAVAVGLVLAIAISASAYTLVLRDGRRIEIPADFTVTRTTITYEISPGFNRTMTLTLVDIAATERVNRESPGGFFKHTEEAVAAQQSQPAPPVQMASRPLTANRASNANRTLTNSDLAAIRQRRIESEEAYEKRRKDLNLPTVEESRRRIEAEDDAFREDMRVKTAANAREEAYWRGRARELRNEIAAVDTQINYVRARIGEVNDANLNNNSWITGVYPTWGGNRRWGQIYPGYPQQWPQTYPGYPQFPQTFPGLPNYRGARPIYGPYGYPNAYPNIYPTAPLYNDNSGERSELVYRLDDLNVRRAGLAAQWRTLEDEARDARVPQVWLEP
jgi:hypothetical protein